MKTRRANDINPNLRAREMRRDVLAQTVRQGKWGPIPSSSTFCCMQALNGLNNTDHTGEGNHFIESNSNANLTQKQLDRHTQKQCLI